MQNSELETMRHSASHVLAEAVLKLFPGAKLGIGPAIDNGFYYDFELPRPIEPEKDFPLIEQEMRRIIARGVPFVRRQLSSAEARSLFSGQPYKLELIEGLEEGAITVYDQDGFVDLCRGPHVASTSALKPDAFKLDKQAGAYWRGDEKRPMLTRLYALAFDSKRDLDAYLTMMKEAEKRDHRKLGRQLELFSTHEEAGPGLVY
jgi:threonyl-tRNA synthetase